MPPLYVLIALLIFWVAIGVVFVAMYNRLVRRRNRCDEAFATMDVYLVKRHDLIPNLVQTVKGYALHESKTLQRVIKARNTARDAEGLNDKVASEIRLEGALKSFYAVAENYPDLKADANFIELQNQLKGVEEDIANARKYYNACVREYSNMQDSFPSNFISNLFNFKKRYMFEADTESRKNVTVDFSK